jgi:hypothetical protein
MTIRSSVNYYRVSFSDGTIEKVPGNYAAHAWAVARQLWPSKDISGLQLVENPSKTAPVP